MANDFFSSIVINGQEYEVNDLESRQNIDDLQTIITDKGTFIYYDTVDNWNRQTDLVAEDKSIYVYTDYRVNDGVNIPAIKIGDGNSYLIDTPFIYSGDASVITQADIDRWNSKSTVTITVTGESIKFDID